MSMVRWLFVLPLVATLGCGNGGDAPVVTTSAKTPETVTT
jgi:hypothetical protein